jgi:hypothetical protein
MMELLIEAERALTHGLLEQAERLFRQVADSDPKNSIAVVGLARIALERGDDRAAYLFGRQALAIDGDNPAAQHLVMRLAEVMAGRGETVPEAAPAAGTPSDPALGRGEATPEEPTARQPEPATGPASNRASGSASDSTTRRGTPVKAGGRRSFIRRILGRRRRR